jgi:hypothetical protein
MKVKENAQGRDHDKYGNMLEKRHTEGSKPTERN